MHQNERGHFKVSRVLNKFQVIYDYGGQERLAYVNNVERYTGQLAGWAPRTSIELEPPKVPQNFRGREFWNTAARGKPGGETAGPSRRTRRPTSASDSDPDDPREVVNWERLREGREGREKRTEDKHAEGSSEPGEHTPVSPQRSPMPAAGSKCDVVVDDLVDLEPERIIGTLPRNQIVEEEMINLGPDPDILSPPEVAVEE